MFCKSRSNSLLQTMILVILKLTQLRVFEVALNIINVFVMFTGVVDHVMAGRRIARVLA
jgi:hypothetical protein